MSPPSLAPRERLVNTPIFLSDHPEGVVVECWVVPGASRTEVKGVHADALRIRVSAPPEGGRANREVCKLLEKIFGARVELVAGETSRRKQVLVRGIDLDRAGQAVSGHV
ncbi:MAG TPA: DUF167 domain-containing protein [Acidimicrobiia bacterium]|jgi:uncharacterized protein (TIGR00251 family)|nr:DUF167 domain-containing protein [Acidimicrobiia bacterium]